VFCSFRPVTLGLILILAGCRSAAPPRGIERLALLPFANLTGDHAYDWLGRGVQIVLNRQLATSRTISGNNYADIAGATQGRATRILHGTLEQSQGSLRLEAYVEDAVTHRQVGERITLKARSEQFLVALDRLAHNLAADASPAPATQLAALAAYVEAQNAPQLEAKTSALARAAQLDPQFALPLLSLAELNLNAGRRDEAQAAITAAATRQLDPMERGQLALLSANLSQDRGTQAQALQQVAAAAPSQPNVQLFTAGLLYRLRQMAPAVAAIERAAKVDPENGEIWNRLGYAQAYLGRLPAAREALETYQKLEPAEPNPLDSLGEVHYLAGKFKAAADYFQTAYARAPQFEGGRAILKAAYSRLLDGQFEPANQSLAQYLKTAGATPAAEIARAHFLYSSGQPAPALKLLEENAAKSTGPLAALYQTHRCGLSLRTDRAQAQAAARAAISGGASAPAILCFFISQPSTTPAEWTARADKAFAAPQARDFRRQALAYALFFDAHYADAFPLIETLLLESHPDADSELRAFHAECQWRTGRWKSVRDSVTRWPLPAQDSIFAGLHIQSFLDTVVKTAFHFEDNEASKRWAPISEKIARPIP